MVAVGVLLSEGICCAQPSSSDGSRSALVLFPSLVAAVGPFIEGACYVHAISSGRCLLCMSSSGGGWFLLREAPAMSNHQAVSYRSVHSPKAVDDDLQHSSLSCNRGIVICGGLRAHCVGCGKLLLRWSLLLKENEQPGCMLTNSCVLCNQMQKQL